MQKIIMLVLLSIFIVSEALADKQTKALIEDDFGDTTAEAQSIELGITINGLIETSGDLDVFSFTLDQADGIVIDNAGTSTYDYPYIVLYDSSNTEMAKKMVSTNSEVASMNLTAGTYYIVVYRYDDGTPDYHFDLRINGENATSILLDQATVDYCKADPSACGITVETVQNTATVTKEYIDSLGSGWHLIGTSFEIADLSIFDSVKIVWTYNGTSWSVYSKNDADVSTSSFNQILTIPSNSGIWIEK